MDARQLLKLPAKSLQTILERLAEAASHREVDPDAVLPKVTLHLHSGRDMSGWLLKLGTDRGETQMLFQWDTTGLNPSEVNVFYVQVHSIESITVHDALKVSSFLSFESSVSAGPITRLALARKAETMAKALADDWKFAFEIRLASDKSSDSEENLSTLHDALVTTVAALRDIGKDEMGRQSLAEHIASIVLTAGASPMITPNSTDRSVIVVCSRQKPWSLPDLRSELMKSL